MAIKRGRIRLYFEGEERGVDEAAKKSTRAIDRVDAATKRYNATADKQATSIDRVNERNFKLSSSTKSLSRDTHSLSKHLQDANIRFTSMRNAVSLIKWPALISGVGYATEGLGAMTAGATALTSALAPLSGALVAYPALLGAFAQGLGVGKLALFGVSDALGEMTQMQATAGETAKESGKAQEAAAEGVRSAEVSLSDAQRSAKRAQTDLSAARKEAVADLKDLKNASTQAGFGEEQAAEALKNARAELREASMDPGSHDPGELPAIERQVREAKQGLKEARLEKQRADRDAAQGSRQGVDGNPKVVDAKRQLNEADRQASDAARSLTKAQRDQREAIEGTTGAASSLNQKLAEMPPAAQHFARFLFGLRPKLKELQNTAAEGLLPGVEEGIKSALPLLPRLNTAVGGTASVMARAAQQAGRFLGSKAFGRDFAKVADGNATFLGRMASSGMKLFSALRHVMVAAQPFIDWLGKSAVGLATWIDGAAKAGRESGSLGRFFDQTRLVMERLGSILSSVGGGLLEIGKAAAPLGRQILGALDQSAQGFEDWTKSVEGKNSLKDYFEQAKPGIFEMGRLVGDVVKAFFSLSNHKGFFTLTHELRTKLLPVLTEVIGKTTEAFGPHLVNAVVKIAELFGHLASSSGPLTVFVDTVARMAGWVNTLLEKVPGLDGLVVTLAGAAAVSKSLKFLGMVTGLKDAVGLAKKLAGWVGIIDTAEATSSSSGIVGGLGKGSRGGGLKGKLGGLLGIGTTAATTIAPMGMLSGAEVGAAGGAAASSGGLLAAAPAAAPWLAVGAAIAAAGAGLFLLYKHSKAFRDIVDPVGDAAKAAFGEVKAQLAPLGDAVEELAKSFGGNGGLVGEVKAFYRSFKGPIDAIGVLFKSTLVHGVEAAFDRIGESIRGVGKILSGQVQVIRGAVEIITGILTLKFGKAWEGVKDMFGGGIKVAIGFLQAALSPITSTVRAIDGVLRDVFGGTWEKVKDIFRDGANAVVGFVQDIADVINLIPGIPDIHINSKKSFADRAGNTNSAPGQGDGGLGKYKSGVDHRYSGGPITRPMAIVGEEAPAHHEWVIATNPRYRQNNIGYWMQAGRDLGVPGFALGGVWNAAKGAASSVGSSVAGAVGNVVGKGAGYFVDKLPKPDLPAWMKGLGTYAIKQVSEYIKGGFKDKKLGSLKGLAGTHVATGPIQKMAREMVLNVWGPQEWSPFSALEMSEAAWDPHADNPTSTAYGLAQNLYPSTYPPAGRPGSKAPILEQSKAQLQWMVKYIKGRYGTPAAAWDFHQSNNWYAKGGKIGGRAGSSATGAFDVRQLFSGNSKGTAGRAVEWAKNNLGTQEGSAKELKWAEETGGAVDPWCATFVSAAMKAQGLPLPSNPSYSGAFLNWAGGDTVGSSLSDAIPGDVLVFNPDGVGITDHVGIYIGGGQFISGNWSNEVGQAAVSDEGGLVGVVRPHYPGGEGDPAKGGKGGAGGKHPAPSFPAGHTGKGGGTYGQKGPQKGKKPHYTEAALPGLAAGALSATATALPSQIQAMLSAPGLTFGQQLSIGELAGTIAGGTTQRTFDAAGNETSADSHADDIAAAKFEKELVQKEKQKIKKRLAEIAKELRKKQTAKKQRALLAEQAQLQTKLGEKVTTLQGLNSTINTGADAPETEAPTATDFANRDLALAELTAGTEDDKAALEALKGIAKQQLDVALTTADPRDDIEAANNLKSVTQALENLDQTMKESLEQQLALVKQKNEEMQKTLAGSQSQYGVLAQAITAVVSGQIGGQVGLGFQTPSVAGSLASY
jgi:cell wall-associated NlpC family hydrolase/phage-related protein